MMMRSSMFIVYLNGKDLFLEEPEAMDAILEEILK